MTPTDTVVLRGEWGPMTFVSPVRVLRAHTPGEVERLLDRVDAYVSDGYYAAGYVSYDAGPSVQQERSRSQVPSRSVVGVKRTWAAWSG